MFVEDADALCFNTASGMRSIAIFDADCKKIQDQLFQYRKRYEVYCNLLCMHFGIENVTFQYRKRYEVYCNEIQDNCVAGYGPVSIPQAV